MKKTFAYFTLAAALCPIPGLADEVAYTMPAEGPTMAHVSIAFRNPITTPRAPSDASNGLALASMVILQGYDAVNSSRIMREPYSHEVNPQYAWASKHGALGYALSFAAFDVAELAVGRMFHVKPREVETFQTEQSAEGIIYTNTHNLYK